MLCEGFSCHLCITCLHHPDCGSNWKTKLCDVSLCLCSGVKSSITQAAENESSLRSKRCPKQRLLLPLVESSGYDSACSYLNHSSIVLLWFRWQRNSTLWKKSSLLDQIVQSLHSCVPFFIRYRLSCTVMYTPMHVLRCPTKKLTIYSL